MVQCIIEESGEHIIAGAGELHLEICLKVNLNYLKLSCALASWSQTSGFPWSTFIYTGSMRVGLRKSTID